MIKSLAGTAFGSAFVSVLLAYLLSHVMASPMTWRLYVVAFVMPLIIAPIFAFPRVRANVRLSKAHAELHTLARTDMLTGLPNRRAFFEAAEDLRLRTAIKDTHLVLMMVDIDHFKRVNDVHGHAAGDTVLRELGATIVAAAGTGRTAPTLVARIGGEEFAVATVISDAAEATRMADAIVAAVRDRLVMIGSTPVKSTVSIGIASGASETSVDRLLKRADDAAYMAKRAGRDRWCFPGQVATPAADMGIVRMEPRLPRAS